MDEPVKTRALFFGCWNEAGHFMWSPGGGRPRRSDDVEYAAPGVHLDGSLAPRNWKSTYYGVGLCWQAQGETREKRDRIGYNSNEYPEGQFLRHFLPNGFTAIQWWDRHQGDSRGACNSTMLLEGEHTTEEMLAALRQHFPHVVANLERGGISLVEVHKTVKDV
jgi:hypothetical protein